MKTRALLLLTCIVSVSSACSGSEVTELAGDAAWIVGRNKPQSDLQARPASALAPTHDTNDADDDADHRDTDDAVEGAGATTEDDQALPGDAALASESADNAEQSSVDSDGAQDRDGAQGVDGPDVRLIDAQIAAVLTTLNQALIAQAQVALPKLSDAALRTLAADLAMQQMAAQARQEAIVAKKRLSAKENPTSTQLAADAATLLAELDAELACDGERAYLTLSSELHEKVLALFSKVLAPSVCDGELKTELSLAQAELLSTLERTRALGLARD
jgi:hypothetical protein